MTFKEFLTKIKKLRNNRKEKGMIISLGLATYVPEKFRLIDLESKTVYAGAPEGGWYLVEDTEYTVSLKGKSHV